MLVVLIAFEYTKRVLIMTKKILLSKAPSSKMKRVKLTVLMIILYSIYYFITSFTLKEISDLPLIHPLVWSGLWRQSDLVRYKLYSRYFSGVMGMIQIQRFLII